MLANPGETEMEFHLGQTYRDTLHHSLALDQGKLALAAFDDALRKFQLPRTSSATSRTEWDPLCSIHRLKADALRFLNRPALALCEYDSARGLAKWTKDIETFTRFRSLAEGLLAIGQGELARARRSPSTPRTQPQSTARRSTAQRNCLLPARAQQALIKTRWNAKNSPWKVSISCDEPRPRITSRLR